MKEIRKFQKIFPKSLCEELIEFYDSIGPETSNGVSQNNSELDALELSNPMEEKVKFLIQACLEPYRIDNQICEEPLTYRASRVVKYIEGSYCGIHYDSELLETAKGEFKPRPVNIVTFLNEDFEGGLLEFPNQNITFKPEVGSIIVFPTSFPYKHKVSIIKGERYVLVSSIVRDKIKLY